MNGNKCDVIVIGAGHAGIEAALACARMGFETLLITLSKKTIGAMSCNPAIGGIGKGQLVKEIDALGGEMAKAADACAIQYRTLNRSKGPAVQSTRAQIDMEKYNNYMIETVEKENSLSVIESEVIEILVEDNKAKGVVTVDGNKIYSKSVILCPGTFLDGLIHVGLRSLPGGRYNEISSKLLTKNLEKLNFKLMRFKTGTCPRLDKNTINFKKLTIQEGDENPIPFSFSTEKINIKQVPCYITYTNQKTHKIIRDNLDKSPLYTGIIKATGVRYCPSIEDKVVKFADKERHQIFLEPEGTSSIRIYPNGLSTSLPEEVQEKIIKSIEGLEDAKILRYGYGIEHTVIDATSLYPTLEAKHIKNLFLAGQINGTTGYEEAAAQGIIAGINAGLKIKNKEPLIIDRSTGYIGVLIDDLTTKGTQEPYRMFTSRAEYRMILREDNADLRLSEAGYRAGLLKEEIFKKVMEKKEEIKKGIEFARKTKLSPLDVNNILAKLKTTPLKHPVSVEELLKRPEIHFENLKSIKDAIPQISLSALKEVEIEIKYSGYIKIQESEIKKFRKIEKIILPDDIDYLIIPGLSNEVKEKLKKFKPHNLGQASRISGITPSAVSILMIYLKKRYSVETNF